MNPLAVVIVNRNCLNHTKNLMKDLSMQTNRNFDIFLIDNASTERGTEEFLKQIENNTPHKVIRNHRNISLNKIWNSYAHNSSYEFISFLNNDILIPTNFIDDTLNILQREKLVTCVIHATNHPSYSVAKKNLDYVVLDSNLRVRQGWDFTVRTCNWINIPDILQFYCGDDFIYEMIKRKNLKVAVALSSPIIHYQGQTRKNSPKEEDQRIRNVALNDINEYKKLGFPHIWEQLSPYSKIAPTFTKISYEK
jgi:glycosyltransferase involved in cell wall biosynthesis